MFCKKCGSENPDGSRFCKGCGEELSNQYSHSYEPTAKNVVEQMSVEDLPPEFRPISMWGYLGYSLLFAIPLAGFIIILVFAFGGTANINLKNYARGILCGYLVAFIIVLVFALLSIAGIMSMM